MALNEKLMALGDKLLALKGELGADRPADPSSTSIFFVGVIGVSQLVVVLEVVGSHSEIPLPELLAEWHGKSRRLRKALWLAFEEEAHRLESRRTVGERFADRSIEP